MISINFRIAEICDAQIFAGRMFGGNAKRKRKNTSPAYLSCRSEIVFFCCCFGTRQIFENSTRNSPSLDARKMIKMYT